MFGLIRRILRKIKKAFFVLRVEGFGSFCRKTKNFINVRRNSQIMIKKKMRRAWKRRHGFVIDTAAFGCDKKELRGQSGKCFSKSLKFSIIVPLYNTPKRFLKELIASVLFQTYKNWELCLADGSDNEHEYVGRICSEIAKKDSRIKYKKLTGNGGISGNTNSAIEMASGDWISLLDHDDILHPSALYETMEAICEKDAEFVYTDECVFDSSDLHKILSTNFKPDFAPDYFRSTNYLCHFSSFKKDLINRTGLFDSQTDGAQDFDFFLRLSEVTSRIVHIPKCLYFWRASDTSVAGRGIDVKPYASLAGKRALEGHFNRISVDAEVTETTTCVYRAHYRIAGNPKISIIIPNSDHVEILRECIESILEKSTYTNFEIIIVENASQEASTFEYYQSLDDERIKVADYSKECGKESFNYSKICNFGVKKALGDYILFLNNDTKVISPDWMQEMLMFSQRKDVGVVGAKLYYPNEKIQHAGVLVGGSVLVVHLFEGTEKDSNGYGCRLSSVQDYSAVTGACMLIRREVFEKVGGFDEKFKVLFNDIDLCLKIRKMGLLVVWTPFAELYHYESRTRGEDDTPEKKERLNFERSLFIERYSKELKEGDPYFNKNLVCQGGGFSVLPDAVFPLAMI